MSAKSVVFAYHDVGARCLSVLLEHAIDVRLVLTHGDDPGEQVWFASVEALARARGLQVATPDDASSPDLLRELQAIAPEFLFSFYYRRMLPPPVLATARRGAYNMHGSLLPKYRGRAPVNWAILEGERETGASLHQMTAKPDAGGILDQQAVPIGENDVASDVLERVTDAAEQVLRRTLPRLLDGTARARPQDLAAGSYYGGRRPEDGRIDWSRPAREVHDLVRAVAPPYPGAFTRWASGPARILRSWWGEVPPALGDAAPGTVSVAEGRLFARCADRWLELLEVEIDGAATLRGSALAACFAGSRSRMGESAS